MILQSTGDVEAKIFTTSFRMVSDQPFGTIPQGTHAFLPIEVKDKAGVPLANGLYYVVVQGPGQKRVFKLLILR